jgi:phosphatidate cytidylyltransferase
VFYLALPFQGLVWLRAEEGAGFLLWLLVIVWATDTAAMVAGRGIGGPAFAPSVSPNKTWSGMLGGLMGGLIVGLLAGDIFGVHPPWAGPWAALLVAAAALAGDMAESALKRLWGVKNTSALIPGHGGVLDRLDSLLGASAVAVALALLHPAL